MSALDIFIAIEQDDPAELALVLEYARSHINELDDYVTPLWFACDQEPVNLEIVDMLLAAGASPNPKNGCGSELVPYLIEVGKPEIAKRLVRSGADLCCPSTAERRVLLGYGDDRTPFVNVTKAEYLHSRHRRFGNANPEDLTDSYKRAMFRRGFNGYLARDHFNDKVHDYHGTEDGRYPDAVWCADRFGQTMNLLADGRWVLIGGEHEDYYDPDFCIYNDVIVVTPEDHIQVLGYPLHIFPTTDWHTATVFGDEIFIIGGLGYRDQRTPITPVYVLSTVDFSIRSFGTSGSNPGRIYKHHACRIGENCIRISGGKRAVEPDYGDNERDYSLNINTGLWTELGT